MPCSICNKAGHNKATCHQRNPKTEFEKDENPTIFAAYKKYDLDVTATISQLQNLTLSKSKIHGAFPTKQKDSYSSSSDTDGSVQSGSSGTKLKSLEEWKSKSKRETRRSSTEGEHFEVYKIGGGVISKAKFEVSTPLDSFYRKSTRHDSRKCATKSTYDGVVDGYLSKIEEPKIIGENKNWKTELSLWENIKIKEKDKDILNKKALKRFHQGPSQDDGPGHIYMYKQQNPFKKTDEEVGEIMFKIGCCHQLPRRRVHTQEVRNKETYDIVYSEEVNYRKLAELLIHLRLKEKGKHCQRLVSDGGTEWFKGKKGELIQDINLVVRFVHIYSPSNQK